MSGGRAARGDLALVLTGGGARGAYQVGVLRGLARRLPELRFPIIIGVSAGAINASFLAAHPGTLAEAAEELCALWCRLRAEDIFRIDTVSLARHFTHWAARLASGGMSLPEVHGLVDTRPLYATVAHASAAVDGEFIGIQRNLERGTLKALALTALNYSTEQTVTWVQARHFHPWSQPRHRSLPARISVEHVMASSALPLFFPAVRLGDDWYGDGGIRLSTPLAPALRLGATRILAISPHHEPTLEEAANRPRNTGYPPPAQILSQLMDAIFLDVLDEDVRRLESINCLLAKLPLEARGSLRQVEIRTIRPSQALGRLATAYEPRLPASFRYLTRSLGTKETDTSDFLSFLMFQPDYLQRLLEMGEEDADARLDDVRALIEGIPGPSEPPAAEESVAESIEDWADSLDPLTRDL
ncbi:MAG TPA: patatin-like phospholipase family protein [Thermoanaerobaculia bacterium]|jgi:NTE family protein|nr:patatin-like phospholipase family protein [Thermoanaerobaculia bacterium]